MNDGGNVVVAKFGEEPRCSCLYEDLIAVLQRHNAPMVEALGTLDLAKQTLILNGLGLA